MQFEFPIFIGDRCTMKKPNYKRRAAALFEIKQGDISGYSGKIVFVAARAWVSRKMNNDGIDVNLIAKYLKRDRTTILYYLNEYKPHNQFEKYFNEKVKIY